MSYQQAKALLTGHLHRSPECAPARASMNSDALLGDGKPAGRCLVCHTVLDATEELRVRLHALGEERRRAEEERDIALAALRSVVREGHGLGLGPTELAALSGLSRRSVYDLLAEEVPA